MKTISAYLGLGSNLEHPLQQLQTAIKAIEELESVCVDKLSSFYATKPVGPQDQPDYVNAVARIETSYAPLELLDALQEIEQQQGRVRDGERWGPRTLDLDILLYDDEVIDHPRLIVPHPEIQNRAFVLYPLSEIAPDLYIPKLGELKELLKSVDENLISIMNNNN